MRKFIIPVFLLFLFFLASCSDNSVGEETFNIRIGDEIAISMIGPVYGDDSEANTELTHYRISLFFSTSQEINVSSAAAYVSDYLAKKTTDYSFTGILSGKYWAVEVEAFADLTGRRGDIETPDDGSVPQNLVKVAEVYAGEKQEDELPSSLITGKLVAGHGDNFVDITIDELAAGTGYKGTVLNVSMILPQGLSEDTWYYELSLASSIGGDNLLIETEQKDTVAKDAAYTSTSADTDGVQYDVYTAEIDVSNINQGIYFLTVNVNNSSVDPSIIRSAIMPVQIIPGTASKGDVDLSYETEIEEAPLVITDKTGKIVELAGVTFSFKYDSIGKTLTLSTDNYIDTSAFSDVNCKYIIDGKLKTSNVTITTESSGSSSKKFNCRFLGDEISAMQGEHIVTLIVYDAGNPLVFGSVTSTVGYYPDNSGITVEEVV